MSNPDLTDLYAAFELDGCSEFELLLLLLKILRLNEEV